MDAFATGDAKKALSNTDELLSRGISTEQFIESVVERLRDLMVLCACGSQTDLVELSEQARKEEAERSARFDAAGLTHMIALCESVNRSIKNSASPRAMLEALVVRLAMTERLADVTAVVMGRDASPAITAKKR